MRDLLLRSRQARRAKETRGYTAPARELSESDGSWEESEEQVLDEEGVEQEKEEVYSPEELISMFLKSSGAPEIQQLVPPPPPPQQQQRRSLLARRSLPNALAAWSDLDRTTQKWMNTIDGNERHSSTLQLSTPASNGLPLSGVPPAVRVWRSSPSSSPRQAFSYLSSSPTSSSRPTHTQRGGTSVSRFWKPRLEDVLLAQASSSLRELVERSILEEDAVYHRRPQSAALTLVVSPADTTGGFESRISESPSKAGADAEPSNLLAPGGASRERTTLQVRPQSAPLVRRKRAFSSAVHVPKPLYYQPAPIVAGPNLNDPSKRVTTTSERLLKPVGKPPQDPLPLHRVGDQVLKTPQVEELVGRLYERDRHRGEQRVQKFQASLERERQELIKAGKIRQLTASQRQELVERLLAAFLRKQQKKAEEGDSANGTTADKKKKKKKKPTGSDGKVLSVSDCRAQNERIEAFVRRNHDDELKNMASRSDKLYREHAVDPVAVAQAKKTPLTVEAREFARSRLYGALQAEAVLRHQLRVRRCLEQGQVSSPKRSPSHVQAAMFNLYKGKSSVSP